MVLGGRRDPGDEITLSVIVIITDDRKNTETYVNCFQNVLMKKGKSHALIYCKVIVLSPTVITGSRMFSLNKYVKTMSVK